MGFMDRLKENPSGAGGIFGMPKPESDDDVFSLVNRIKDRNFQDYQKKAQFDDDMNIRREMRMRNLFDPKTQVSNNQTGEVKQLGTMPLSNEQQVQQTQRMQEPKLALDARKLDLDAKLGQGKMDLAAEQAEFNRLKNEQINQDRDLERQRKTDDTTRRLELAQQTLNDRTATSEARIAAQKEIAAAMEERHRLERMQKDNQFKTTSDQAQQRIDALEERLRQAGLSETVTEINPEGTQRTTTTRRGDAAGSVRVIGRDGKIYNIPKDKADDADAQGPIWKPAGG